MAGPVSEGDLVDEDGPASLSPASAAAAPPSRWAALAVTWSVVVLLVLLPLPILLGEGAGHLAVVAAFAAVTALLARVEVGAARRTFVQLAVIGLAVRGVVLLAVASLEAAGDVVVLGPDGLRFLRGAQAILAAGFALPRPSYEEFASYDTAHMYLFAGIIGYLGPSLLNLHAVNCALTALLGPLTFGWARLVAPRAALPAGLLLTLYPSITYLAAVDLWKDPSVITVTILSLWAMAHIVHGNLGRWPMVALAAVAAGSLWYVHTSRFYVLWYLEVGLAVMTLVGLARGWTVRRTAVVAMVGVVMAAEAGPMLAGWPASPVLFVASVAQATEEPSLRAFTAGLLDRVPRNDAARPDRATLETIDLGLQGEKNVLQVDIETASAAPGRFGPAGSAIQMARRVWGPFVWIPPPSFTPRAILGGDYLFYPGMVFWYVLLPGMFVGLAVTGWELVRGRTPFILGVAWVFSVLYGAQFLVVNLSYRQREALFPVLVIFAWLGFEHVRHRPWARKAYAAYWIALVSVAATHTALRLWVMG